MNTHKKYQLFIAHKHTDEDNRETRDSLLAQMIFNAFVSRGISAFLAQEEISRVGETEYMRTIDQALDESEILVVVASNPEYLESRWVRYEWESFVSDILSGRKKNGRIFSYIDGFLPDSLPRPLRLHQVIIHSEGQVDRLFNNVSAALQINKLGDVTQKGEQTVDQFQKITKLIAESHLLEMEIFTKNPLGQIAMSKDQLERMEEIINQLRHITKGVQTNKIDSKDT